MNIRIPDLLMQQLAHSSRRLGRDLLRLVTDVHLGHIGGALVRGQPSRHHPDEGGLSGAVLPEHDQDLGVCEVAGVDLQPELAHLLLHVGVGVARHPLHLSGGGGVIAAVTQVGGVSVQRQSQAAYGEWRKENFIGKGEFLAGKAELTPATPQ